MSAEFRIVPVRDLDELRTESLLASPPEESGIFRTSELIPIVDLDPTIRVDLRYAGTNNFLGYSLYTAHQPLLQRPAAHALVAANRHLSELGKGLQIYDAYRPWWVTRLFWEATPVEMKVFVANPESGSRHNRGCAVDVGLFDIRTGSLLEMPGEYDEFTERASIRYAGGPPQALKNRDLLIETMQRFQFTVYEEEWWHFDHADWNQYRLMNIPLQDL